MPHHGFKKQNADAFFVPIKVYKVKQLYTNTFTVSMKIIILLNEIQKVYKTCDISRCRYDRGNLKPKLETENNTETPPKNDKSDLITHTQN